MAEGNEMSKKGGGSTVCTIMVAFTGWIVVPEKNVIKNTLHCHSVL